MSSHTTEMTILVTPEMANFSGKMHGGEILRHLDLAAYACASRYCGNYTVTISVDTVIFKNPIYIGEMVTFMATVNYTGRTSMEIGIKVIAENIKDHSVRHTNTCYFTMVSMGEDGKTIPVEPLKLETDPQKRRYKAAEKRRESRKALVEATKGS